MDNLLNELCVNGKRYLKQITHVLNEALNLIQSADNKLSVAYEYGMKKPDYYNQFKEIALKFTDISESEKKEMSNVIFMIISALRVPVPTKFKFGPKTDH